MGKKAPGSYPLDPTAILLFFDPNRRYLPVLVHQASVRPLLAAAFLFFVVVLSKDHTWLEQLNHRHHHHNSISTLWPSIIIIIIIIIIIFIVITLFSVWRIKTTSLWSTLWTSLSSLQPQAHYAYSRNLSSGFIFFSMRPPKRFWWFPYTRI